jgi:hypothetical protein
MPRTPQIRPKCNLRIQVPASSFLSAIQNQLNNKQDVRGRLVNNHIYLQLPESEQHYWSPELHVTVLEEENGTTVKGIAGPNGKVWATFMVFYGLAIMLFIFGGSLGLSEWYLGMRSNWIWSIPVSVVLYGLILIAAQYGQRLGAGQLIQLREYLDDAIEMAESQHLSDKKKVPVNKAH